VASYEQTARIGNAKRSVSRPRRRFALALLAFDPAARLWRASCKAYHAKLYPLAWFLKFVNFLLFRSILSFECEIGKGVAFTHYGLGTVVHPNVTIGDRVRIFHHVTLAAESYIGSSSRIVIEDDVTLGAHCIVIGNDRGGVRIGAGATIGAGAIVVRDVPPGATVVAMPSRPVKQTEPS